MSAGTRSTLAVVAALVISTMWSAASAIAVLLGIAHIIDPLAPPPPARLVTAARRARRPSPSPKLAAGVAHSQRQSPPSPSPSALSRTPSFAALAETDTEIELLISPTLTDEPASFLSPSDLCADTGYPGMAPPSISISRSPSPPPGSSSSSRMKRMFSFDPSMGAQRGRSPGPSLSGGADGAASRPAAKDRHAVSAEIARAAWVRPSARRAKGRRAS